MNHDALGAFLLIASPVWCWAYIRFNRKAMRGDYDE